MRYYFTLFVVFSVGALVLAAPTDKKPTTSVNKEDVTPGNVYWTRLKFLEPKGPSFQHKQANRNHPVMVVSDVDAHDKVKVAQISSNPVQEWGSNFEPASNYADIKGFINVGPPHTVHLAHLPVQKKRTDVRPGRLQPLIDRINANCPTDQQLTLCEPPGSAQGNTVHGRPEHDHSKQSSQQSSSSKGSSSQVSQPGSPKQSSHSPSQGSQLDGSKQSSQQSSSNKGSSSQVSRPGSPKQSSQKSSSSQGGSKQGTAPRGSSDDGWQVVTGRRSNKARGSGNK